MDDKYTGREIAIITDTHALLEPLKAVLEDIDNKGITEIYSLGDNIGLGPNPSEVIDLLSEYSVKSIAGNHEEYITLGIEPFISYFNAVRTKDRLWTLSKLNEKQIGKILLYPRSIEMLVGGEKIALCHFANDVRIDFIKRGVFTYNKNLELGDAYKQFLYTNSEEQKEEIEQMIKRYGINNPLVKGYLSSKNDPLFKGKKVEFFDSIIQGHIHFKIYEESESTKFYSIRALAMAHDKDPVDTASYVILKEKTKNKGFDLIEVLVKYDREKMKYSILQSDIPNKDTLKKYTSLHM